MRKNIEMVEEGLKGLITETLLYTENKVVSFANVLTNHDGRLYVYASGTRQKIVAVVSSLPAIAFSRSLLQLLNDEANESLLPIVYSLCELPILPVPNISYQFQFANSSASIRFSELEHVIDLDMDVVVLNILSPIMIVKAWEALIVERRVVVASVNTALLLPVCEFLKKLIAPFSFVGTYIPVIPSSGIEALEAPGNFIIGVDSTALKGSTVSLSGIVLVDLDRRSIIHTPTTPDDPYYAAPSCLISYLHRAVTQVLDDPLSKWMSRSAMDSNQICPYSPEAWSQRATNVVRVFVKANLSILSAQYCTARAFFRSVSRSDNESFLHTLGFSFTKDPLALMGYSEHRSVHVGCMQLWKDPRIIEDAIHHTIPCWVEMDNCAFALYEQADDLPLLLIPIEEFEAVASSSMEPEGHVFEVTLKNQSFYRFTTSDSNSRKLWLHAIEKKMNAVSKGYQIVSTANALQMRVKSQYISQSSNGIGTALSNVNNSGIPVAGNQEEIELPFSSDMLGLSPFEATLEDSSETEHYHDFRHLIRKTQLSLTLYMVTECERFETLFTKRAESLYSFIYDQHSYDAQMKKYISTIFRTSDTLRAISLDVENNRDAILGRSHPFVATDGDSQSSPVKSPLSRSTTETDVSSDGRSVEDESGKKKGIIHRWFSTSRPSKSAKVRYY
jgi:hypothetical protein